MTQTPSARRTAPPNKPPSSPGGPSVWLKANNQTFRGPNECPRPPALPGALDLVQVTPDAKRLERSARIEERLLERSRRVLIGCDQGPKLGGRFFVTFERAQERHPRTPGVGHGLAEEAVQFIRLIHERAVFCQPGADSKPQTRVVRAAPGWHRCSVVLGFSVRSSCHHCWRSLAIRKNKGDSP